MTPEIQAALDQLRDAHACARPTHCGSCHALDVITQALAATSWEAVGRQLQTQQAEVRATLDSFGDLRPYARHREGCPQAPCACGLAALLA